MSSIRIAKRYAKSLLDLAVEENALESTWKDIQFFQQALKSRDLLLLIKSPIIKGSKKQRIFDKLFEGKVTVMTKSFFELIIRKGRESLLPEIVEMFNSQYRDFKSISTVTLRTAISLEEDTIEAIRKKLKSSTETKENIELNVVVDPTLIGGFAIEFQDKQYNSSIAYKLGQMRKQFSSN